ncbi:MAG: hypothetical protein IKG27_00255 [Bacilli bacterium]|nr:hypothetical protein [Bacilli bacterium]
MVNRQDIEKEILRGIKSGLKECEENYAPSNEIRISTLNKLNENLEEAASIQAVRRINDLFNAYHSHTGQYEPDTRYNSIGIEDQNSLNSVIGQFPSNTVGYILLDEKRQEIYEKMGFEGKLPTHEEIFELESRKRKCTTREEEIELEKQIELKKLALAEIQGQFELDLPRLLSTDIERKAAIETEMAQRTAESRTR